MLAFIFITPTVLMPFVRYLAPMDKKKYDLEIAKINANKELSELKLQVKMLEAELGKLQGHASASFAPKKQGQLPAK